MAGQLACQPHVLAAATDGEAELVIGHDDLDAAFFLVQHDAADSRRLERVDHEGREVSSDQGMISIFSPCNSCTTACTRLPFMPTAGA